MGDNSLVNWRLEPQHCKEHAHMVVVLPRKIVGDGVSLEIVGE